MLAQINWGSAVDKFPCNERSRIWFKIYMAVAERCETGLDVILSELSPVSEKNAIILIILTMFQKSCEECDEEMRRFLSKTKLRKCDLVTSFTFFLIISFARRHKRLFLSFVQLFQKDLNFPKLLFAIKHWKLHCTVPNTMAGIVSFSRASDRKIIKRPSR